MESVIVDAKHTYELCRSLSISLDEQLSTIAPQHRQGAYVYLSEWHGDCSLAFETPIVGPTEELIAEARATLSARALARGHQLGLWLNGYPKAQPTQRVTPNRRSKGKKLLYFLLSLCQKLKFRTISRIP